MTISSSVLVLIIFINGIIGLLVYLRPNRDKGTASFFVIIMSIFLWATPLFFYGLTDNSQIALNLSRISYFAAAMSALALFNFALDFTVKNLSKFVHYALYFFNFCVTILLLLLSASHFLLVRHSEFANVRVIQFGSLYPVYITFIIIAFAAGLIIIYKNYLKEDNLVRKKQLQLIFSGILLTILGGIVTNLILPTSGNFSLYWLGPAFTLIMAIFISISILEYQLFNLKIVATQFFIITLWIFIFVRTVISESFQEQLMNGLLLLATIVIGIFLIKSVKKEVKQREQIEKLATQLENFIHFLSHEVKGILGKNRMMFESMREGDFGEIPEQLKPLVDQSFRDTTSSVNMVMNILQSSDIKNGKLVMNKTKFDFKASVKDLVEKIRPDVIKKGLSLEVKIYDQGDCFVYGDKNKIEEHVIRNLLTNSLAYTTAGEVIVGLVRENDKVRFYVKDTGLGLSENTKAKLFTEGGKGDESSKVNIHSTGYGLFFAKGIVEAHGGKIWAESEGEGKGSTFYVEFKCVS